MRFADPTYSAHVATGTNVGHILFIQHLVEVGYAPVGVRYLCAVSTRAVAADAGTRTELTEAQLRALLGQLDAAAFHAALVHSSVVVLEVPLMELERRAAR